VQLPKIALVEKPTDHVRRDLACALQIKLVPGRELKPSIGACQRSLETSMEKAVGIDHDQASSAAIRMAVGNPEELRWFGLACHAASIGRELGRFNVVDETPALRGRGTVKPGPGPREADKSHVASQRWPSGGVPPGCRPENEPLSQRLQAQTKEMVANTHNPTPAAAQDTPTETKVPISATHASRGKTVIGHLSEVPPRRRQG
jgi:hypothetical protein